MLVHAFGAVLDNPELLAIAVVGDGEAETGPLEGSWKGISFLNPARDGTVLPILHLNDGKISGPTVLGRKPAAEVRSLLEGHGYQVLEVTGDDSSALPSARSRSAASEDTTVRACPGCRTRHLLADPRVNLAGGDGGLRSCARRRREDCEQRHAYRDEQCTAPDHLTRIHDAFSMKVRTAWLAYSTVLASATGSAEGLE